MSPNDIRRHSERDVIHMWRPVQKLLAPLLVVALAAAFPVKIQAQGTSAPLPTSATGWSLSREDPFVGLNLTAAQVSALTALTERTRAARVAITSQLTQGKPMPATTRAELRKITDAHNAAVLAELTEPQRERLQANLAALRTRRAQVTGGEQ